MTPLIQIFNNQDETNSCIKGSTSFATQVLQTPPYTKVGQIMPDNISDIIILGPKIYFLFYSDTYFVL